MKARLKRLHSPDVADLRDFRPADPDVFSILVQAMIGPDSDEDSSESFDIVVCTPRWLDQRLNDSDELFDGRHYLFCKRFSYDAVWKYIDQKCRTCAGPDWPSVAAQLSRFGKWEFEDYRE